MSSLPLGFYLPEPLTPNIGLSYLNTAIIDATGEKIAFVGPVHFTGATTKAIRKIHLRLGTPIVNAGGSALTVSLQDPATTGPPMVPDEVQDQTVAIANGSLVANTWLTTGNLSADRTVALGEILAIVIEYDVAGRLGADSVIFSLLTHTSSVTGAHSNQSYVLLKSGGGPTWAQIAGMAVVLLEFSDGTFGSLIGSVPFSAVSSLDIKQDSAADEVALRFKVPDHCGVNGGWWGGTVQASTSDFDIVLYSGTTALATYSVDANRVLNNANNNRLDFLFSSEVRLSPNVEYFLSVKPTQTTSTIRTQHADVNAAGHMGVLQLGVEAQYATRVDLGAWTVTTTRRPMMGLRFSSIGGSSYNPFRGLVG